MKKEELELDDYFVIEKLIHGYTSWGKNEYNTWEDDAYLTIEDKITSSDSEAGGAYHTIVIQRESDKKYFEGHYTDWDVDNSEFHGPFYEVIAREVTITIYE